MPGREVLPPSPKGLYKVVVEFEQSSNMNGEMQKQRVQLHRNSARTTAEFYAARILQDGLRLDAAKASRFISPHRIGEVQVILDSEDWT